MERPVSLAEARKQKEKERYAALVLTTFDQFEHADKREALDRRAEVERAAKDRL